MSDSLKPPFDALSDLAAQARLLASHHRNPDCSVAKYAVYTMQHAIAARDYKRASVSWEKAQAALNHESCGSLCVGCVGDCDFGNTGACR